MPVLTLEEDAELSPPNLGAQAAFYNDWSNRYCAFVGGVGSGKSFIGARKLRDQTVWNAFDEDGCPTYISSQMISLSYQAAKTYNMPHIDAALRESGLSFKFHANHELYAYQLLDLGTRTRPVYIYVRSAEAGGAIAGYEVGSTWGDEVARWPYYPFNPTEDAFVQADFRMRSKGGRVYQFNMTYTNEGEDTQVYRDFEIEPKPGHRLYRGSTEDNAQNLGPGFVEALRGRLSADLLEQYLRGGVAKLGANNVYYNYDEGRNLQPIELVRGWPLQLRIDFNRVPGMHALVGQHFEEKDLFTTCHELHRPGMLLKQCMQAFDSGMPAQGDMQAIDGWGEAVRRGIYPVLELFGDATGATGQISDGTSCWDVVRAELHGRRIPFRMRVPRRNPGQADRANAVNSAFCSANGTVRYIINPRCARLRVDYRSLKWDKTGKIGKANPDLSHPSDADGYGVEFLMPIYRPMAA